MSKGRPAYNVQIASLPASGLVVGVRVGNVGSDRGLAEPMAAALAARYGHRARRTLVDGGFQSIGPKGGNRLSEKSRCGIEIETIVLDFISRTIVQCAADIEAAHAAGTERYCPPGRTKAGTDPYRVRKGDGPGVAAWRLRRATPQAQAVVRRRARCEPIHAHLRNLTLDRQRVRGLRRVQNGMSGFALALDILTERRLRAARPA